MPRTSFTIVDSPAFGDGVASIAAEAVDNTNGNDFLNDGRCVAIVSNSSGGSLTVTLTLPAGPRTANESVTKTLAVANGAVAHFGPFPPDLYNDTSGKAYLDWSTGTSVTCAIVRQKPTPR